MSVSFITMSGLRVNPMVGAGQISSLSTATASSKFGVLLYSREVGIGEDAVGKGEWLPC